MYNVVKWEVENIQKEQLLKVISWASKMRRKIKILQEYKVEIDDLPQDKQEITYKDIKDRYGLRINSNPTPSPRQIRTAFGAWNPSLTIYS